MDDWIRSGIEKLQATFSALWKIAVGLVILAIPFWLLYRLVAPLFGPDPVGYVANIALAIAACFLFAAVVTGVFMAGAKLYERFSLVRTLLKGIGVLLIALFVLASLSQCVNWKGTSCTPSRYIDCP